MSASLFYVAVCLTVRRWSHLQNKYQLNVYKPPETAFKPVARPESAVLKKWGVHSWLDEAIKIPLDQKNEILSALKDLCSIDRILLASDEALQHIGALQEYLRANGVKEFRIFTSLKVFKISVSGYGQKNTNSVSTMTKPERGLFKTGADAEQQSKLHADKKQAEQALSAHLEGKTDLQQRLAVAKKMVQQANERKDNFKFRREACQLH